MMRDVPLNLDYEDAIVWVQDRTLFPYVRESVEQVTRRKLQSPIDRYGIVAYATLRSDTPRAYHNVYWRRCWYVDDHDAHNGDPKGPYADSGCPGEGCKTSSIIVGVPAIHGRDGEDEERGETQT